MPRGQVDFTILLLVPAVLDLQHFERPVHDILEALVHRRLSLFPNGLLAKLGIAVPVQLVTLSLAVEPGVFLHDLLQTLTIKHAFGLGRRKTRKFRLADLLQRLNQSPLWNNKVSF